MRFLAAGFWSPVFNTKKMSFEIVMLCQENEVFYSPARIGRLSVLEDQTGGHLLPHPIPTGLVKAHSKPVTLELECFGQKKD